MAGCFTAPVEFFSSLGDKYFPISESYELERVAPERTVTVLRSTTTRRCASRYEIVGEFLKLNGFAARVLRELRTDGWAGKIPNPPDWRLRDGRTFLLLAGPFRTRPHLQRRPVRS